MLGISMLDITDVNSLFDTVLVNVTDLAVPSSLLDIRLVEEADVV